MTKSRPLRTSGAPAAGGPPRLDLKLRQHLFTLMLANLLPMLAVGVVMIGVAQGKWTLDTRAGNGVIPLLMVLGACVVLLASLWIILPFGRWLRDRPRWHFHHERRLLWAVPYAAGWCAWLSFWLLGIAAALVALGLLGMGLVRLAQAWMG